MLQSAAAAALSAPVVNSLLANSVAAEPRRGGRIRVASLSSSTADTLDPAKGDLSTDYTRHYMLYSGLTEYDENLRPQLALAESIGTANQISWSINLRRGVLFHDGKELTAQDVVFSLLRHKDPATSSRVSTIAAQFSAVRASGKYTVEVELVDANSDLPAILAASHFLIVQDQTREFATATGTGPFKLKDFRPGIRTVGVRNENYWRPGRPYLDEIELIGIPDEPSRVNALLAGDVQIVSSVNPRSTRRLGKSLEHEVLETPSGLYTDLIMRHDMHPTSNPDFVLAMKYLFDRDVIRRALFRGYASVANDHPIPPSNPYYFDELPQRNFDLDKARYHLNRSGLSGVRLPMFASPAADGSVDMASIVQESAAKIGLRLRVSRVPADGYWSNHWMRHPLGFGNVNPRPTADLAFSLFYKSDAPWNVSGWKNQQFDQLLLAARGEGDPARRFQMYADMQTLVNERCGTAIPVFISFIDAFHSSVKGFHAIPTGGLMGYTFADKVWLES
jgi:peptide/nickel transport system substrate-binding protein